MNEYLFTEYLINIQKDIQYIIYYVYIHITIYRNVPNFIIMHACRVFMSTYRYIISIYLHDNTMIGIYIYIYIYIINNNIMNASYIMNI